MTTMPNRVVYGVHPVEELLRRRGKEVKALLLARRREEGLAALAAARGIPVQAASALELDELCGSESHQGVAAVVGEYAYAELEDLLESPGSEPALLVVLDSITDAGNLGAIFRSALVLGATGVVLPKDRAASVTPAVVRISAGATEHLRCARVTNLARSLEQVREAGIWVLGAVERGGQSPCEADLRGPVAIVLGSEQKGIRPLVRRGCDQMITIRSRSPIASLNVAAAATALLYEATRQRGVASETAGQGDHYSAPHLD
jgi:23S rRNA (guanosine2251-2'-O)-methyltransferase